MAVDGTIHHPPPSTNPQLFVLELGEQPSSSGPLSSLMGGGVFGGIVVTHGDVLLLVVVCQHIVN